MLKEAIVLAGGLGTRLRTVVKDQPKSMATINGRPFLEYLLNHFIANGIQRFIFSVGYKSTHISEYFGNKYKEAEIVYVLEKEPLGTGGAIKKSMELVQGERVVIANGDSLFLVDIQAQYQLHVAQKAAVTFALKYLKNFTRYGTVDLDEEEKVLNFQEKKPMEEGWINGGIYIFDVPTFRAATLPEKCSIEKDFFQAQIEQLHFVGFKSEGYFLDIGIPADFAKAQEEFKTLL